MKHAPIHRAVESKPREIAPVSKHAAIAKRLEAVQAQTRAAQRAFHHGGRTITKRP